MAPVMRRVRQIRDAIRKRLPNADEEDIEAALRYFDNQEAENPWDIVTRRAHDASVAADKAAKKAQEAIARANSAASRASQAEERLSDALERCQNLDMENRQLRGEIMILLNAVVSIRQSQTATDTMPAAPSPAGSMPAESSSGEPIYVAAKTILSKATPTNLVLDELLPREPLEPRLGPLATTMVTAMRNRRGFQSDPA